MLCLKNLVFKFNTSLCSTKMTLNDFKTLPQKSRNAAKWVRNF